MKDHMAGLLDGKCCLVTGQAEDHASAYVFLASEQASAITGVVIVSDGSLHALDPNRMSVV